MKAVIQRVLNANVTGILDELKYNCLIVWWTVATALYVNHLSLISVDGEVISSIGKGLCILIGISRDDTEKDIDYM